MSVWRLWPTSMDHPRLSTSFLYLWPIMLGTRSWSEARQGERHLRHTPTIGYFVAIENSISWRTRWAIDSNITSTHSSGEKPAPFPDSPITDPTFPWTHSMLVMRIRARAVCRIEYTAGNSSCAHKRIGFFLERLERVLVHIRSRLSQLSPTRLWHEVFFWLSLCPYSVQ